MTKQQKTIILIGAVFIVWGGIVMQLFNYLSPKEEILPEVVYQSFLPTTYEEKETYTVKHHKRDPFLDKSSKKKRVINNKVVSTPINFPTVVYNGIIESGAKKSFILTINGRQEILKAGQSMNMITVITGNQKQIVLRYKGKRKVVIRN